jgi:hypothetical protein
MKRQPRRRRASLWAALYVGLFGTPTDETEPSDDRASSDERDDPQSEE